MKPSPFFLILICVNESLSSLIVEQTFTTGSIAIEGQSFYTAQAPDLRSEGYTLIAAKIYNSSNSSYLYQYSVCVVQNIHVRIFNHYSSSLTSDLTIKAYYVKL